MAWFELPSLDWSKPFPVLENWPSTLKPKSGVYLLVALEQDSSGTPIDRVCGRDFSGTLYIGKADSLEGRVCELRKTLRPEDWTSGTHGAGHLLLNTPMRGVFPIKKLATMWALTNLPWEIEEKLLPEYVSKFGEGPPLNRQWPTLSSD